MSVRFVLDSSVLVAAMKPSEPGHRDAVDLLGRLRDATARGEVVIFAPPELWFEVHVAAQRIAAGSGGSPSTSAAEILSGLAITLTPITNSDEIDEFMRRLAERTRGKAPFANATDLVYLWAAWREEAALITLDTGLLKYHDVVCEVVRPFHVRLG